MTPPISDEQLQAIERKCERQDDGQFVFGYEEAMADMATLRQALRERAATIAELRADLKDAQDHRDRLLAQDAQVRISELECELGAVKGELSGANLELAEMSKPVDESEVIALADLLKDIAAYNCSLTEEQTQKLYRCASVLQTLESQVYQLRKPVGVERNETVEAIRDEWDAVCKEYMNEGFCMDEPLCVIDTLLSAYDALAQDCAEANRLLAYERGRVQGWEKQLGIEPTSGGESIADYIDGLQGSVMQLQEASRIHSENAARDASARVAMLAEMRGLRERLNAAEERERRLRSALTETLRKWVELVDSGDADHWDPEKEPHVVAARAALAQPQPTCRTPDQYAIEHGRYLATAAREFMDACNAVHQAQEEFEGCDDKQEEQMLSEALEDATDSRSDHWRGLENAIYEFTKRADRAYPLAQPQGEQKENS